MARAATPLCQVLIYVEANAFQFMKYPLHQLHAAAIISVLKP